MISLTGSGIRFKVACPVGHGRWTYEVKKNWFAESKTFPQLACVHCGRSCLVKQVKDG